MNIKNYTIFCIIIFVCKSILAEYNSNFECFKITSPSIFKVDPHQRLSYRIREKTTDVIKEAIELHTNIFSIETASILATLAPAYVTTRSLDHKFHEKFYDKKHHKNINQPNERVCEAIEKGIVLSVVGLSSLALFSSDEQLRITSRIFAIGAASGLCARNVIKKIRFEPGLRPWNEHFSSNKRSYGGFPSGHMFEAIYMTTVYGLQYGIKAGIPLSIFSSGMLAVSIACNRHYISQTVAGVALGVIYGVAAHRLIERKLIEETSFDFCYDSRGLPSIKLAYYF